MVGDGVCGMTSRDLSPPLEDLAWAREPEDLAWASQPDDHASEPEDLSWAAEPEDATAGELPTPPGTWRG